MANLIQGSVEYYEFCDERHQDNLRADWLLDQLGAMRDGAWIKIGRYYYIAEPEIATMFALKFS